MSSVKKKDKDKEPAVDTSTPDPIDEGFVLWAEKCFEGDERANTFVVTQILRMGGKDVFGDVIRKREFHLSEGKPKHEDLVTLCNELILEMQDEANVHKVPRRFKVEAVNAKKGGVFAMKTIEREPRVMRFAAGDSPGDETDQFGGDILRKRAEQVLADGRFYAELSAQNFAGLAEMLTSENRNLRDHIKVIMEEWIAMAKAKNDADNNALDREEIREDRKFWREAKKKGINLFGALFSDVVKKVTKGAIAPPGRTTESVAIENVLDALSPQERTDVFGDWTDAGERVKVGVLTESQVRIIRSVLNEERPADELDKILPGGPDEITTEQYIAISGKIDMDKLDPLAIILKERQRATVAAAAAAKAKSNQVPPSAPKEG